MDALGSLLSPEVIASILVVGSMVMSIRSILFLNRTASELRPKLEALERQLQNLKNGMGEKKKRVAELTPIVDPLKAAADKMTNYYEHLTDMRLEEEKRVQRTKMGMGGGGN